MNILLHTVTGIETTIQLCHYLTDTGHQSVQSFLYEQDVLDKLQNTQSLLHHVQSRDSEVFKDPFHPVVVATYSVMNILNTIRDDLASVKKMTADHQQRWFHQWYSPNHEEICKSMKSHILIHDLRVRRLMNVVTMLDREISNGSKTNTHKNSDTNQKTTKVQATRHRCNSWS